MTTFRPCSKTAPANSAAVEDVPVPETKRARANKRAHGGTSETITVAHEAIHRPQVGKDIFDGEWKEGGGF